MEKVKKMNYQKELEKLIVKLEKEEKVPRLLLHSCCAPCSSYVLEYLSNYFDITVFYYNLIFFRKVNIQKDFRTADADRRDERKASNLFCCGQL